MFIRPGQSNKNKEEEPLRSGFIRSSNPNYKKQDTTNAKSSSQQPKAQSKPSPDNKPNLIEYLKDGFSGLLHTQSPVKTVVDSGVKRMVESQNAPVNPNQENSVVDIGGYKVGSNFVPVNKNDNLALKTGKGVVNAAVGFIPTVANLFGLAGEGLRQAAIQTESVVTGKGIQPYKQTSFTKDIVLNDKGKAAFEKFQKAHPSVAATVEMFLDTVADPTLYLGAGGIISDASKAKAAVNTTKGVVEAGTKQAEILSKVKNNIKLTDDETKILKEIQNQDNNTEVIKPAQNSSAAKAKVTIGTKEYVNKYSKKLPNTESELVKHNTEIKSKIDSVKADIENLKASNSDPEAIKQSESQLRKLNLQLFSGEQKIKVSEFKTNSMKNSPLLQGEKMQDIVDKIDATYAVAPDAQTIERAAATVDLNMENAMRTIKNKEALNSAEDAATSWMITKKLRQEAEKTGDYTKVEDWLQTVQPKVTSTAQALHAVGLWKKLTPEGVLNTAVKAIDEAKTPEQVKRVNDSVKKARDAVDSLENGTSQKVADDVAKKADEILKKNKPSSPKEPLQPEDILANKIGDYIKEPKPSKIDPVQDMVNELFRVAKESPIDKLKVKARSPIEFVSEALKNRQQYVETWKKAKEIVTEKFKDNPEALSMLEKYFDKGIKPPFSTDSFNKSIGEGMKNLNQNLGDIVKNYYSVGSQSRADLVDHLVSKAGLSGEDAQVLAKYINNKMHELTKAKKDELLKNIFKVKAPVQKGSIAIKSIEELSNLGAFKNENYSGKVLEKLNPRLQSLINEAGIKFGDLVRKGVEEVDFSRTKLMKELSEKLKVNDSDALTIIKSLENRFNALADEKRTSILNNMWKKREASAKKSIFDKITEAINLNALGDAELRKMFSEKYKIPHLSDAVAKKLIEQSKKIEGMADGEAKKVAIELMMKTISDQIPSKFLDKVSTIQTMAQLLNLKTAIRNVGGNFLFGGLENISNVIGAGLDKAVSGITKERSVVLPNLKTQAKGFKKGFTDGVRDAFLGIDTSGMKTQFDLPQTRVFRDKILGSLETAMNIELRATDRAFYKSAFDDSIRQQLIAKGVKEATPEMLEQAHLEGLYKTFQDDNIATKIFTGLKKALNAGGKWGLGDLVLKYPKTPANLLMRGIDYSPAGFLKSIAEITKPLVGKSFNQKAFVQSMSRATVGTAMFGGAMILYDLGIITGKKSSDKDVADLEKTTGVGGYKINLSALKRFVLSGFNPDEAKIQEGDQQMNYDWIQPASITMGAGANASDQIKNKGRVSPLDVLGAVTAGLEGGASTLAEQPVVTGLTKLSQGFGNGDDIVKSMMGVAASAPSSFVPTFLNQIRQTTDNYSRDTKSNAFFDSMLNQVKNKIPGISKGLPVKVNTLGQKVELYQGGTNNPLNVFLNPAFMSKYRVTPGTKLVMDLYRQTDETKQFPRVVSSKTLSFGNKKVTLSANEIQKLQQITGQKTVELLDKLSQNEAFLKLPDDKKVDYIGNKLLDKVGTYSRKVLMKMIGAKELKARAK